MQSRLQPVDIKALPPAHRAIFQAQQTANDELRAEGGFAHTIPTAAWNTSSASCAGRSTTRSPRSARWTIANWRSRTWKARWPRPRKPRLRRAPQQPRPPPSAVPRRRNLGHLPRGLERIEHVIEPDSTQCPCGCGQMIRIGEDRTERLDIVPAQLRVIVTVRPKYACRTCGGRRDPGAGAGDHRRIADRGGAGAGARFQVRRSPTFVPSMIYARSGCTAPRSPAGWARRRFI